MSGADVVPVADAAEALDVHLSTIWRWIEAGCPVVCRGRGRGQKTLVCIETVRCWRDGSSCERTILALASAVPELMEAAIYESWRTADGIGKRQLASVMAAAWYRTSCAMLDALREQHPNVPEIVFLPEKIENLKNIALNK